MWAALAVLGLLLGVAFWMTRPPTPEASTTLLLNVGSEGQAGTAILNDQVMAQSRGVAQLAVHTLGLREPVDSLLTTYKAAVLTDQVLRITASAPSSSQAVTQADAIAKAFLAFRAEQLKTQENLYFASLDDTLARNERQLKAIKARISQVAGQPTSDAQQAQLNSLRATGDQAYGTFVALKQQVNTAKAASQDATAAMIGQSAVLDKASPIPQSRMKPLILFGGAGLVVGLFLGAGFIIIRALVSDRLRRRDDVALALGAPVRLSIPARRIARWLPARRRLAVTKDRDIQRVAAFLQMMLPSESHGSALAVVPVGDTRVAALSVMSLASTMAQQDARVVVADLCRGAPAAKLVGVKDPGVHAVQVDGSHIEVLIAEPDEIAPVGPFDPTGAPTQNTLSGQVASVGASADVLLTLATLDPSLASDHLKTWAADAVVVVTAGASSWTKIHAVGELIRLAGTRLVSAVLVGADKWDESLGVEATHAGVRHAALQTGDGITETAQFDDATMSRLVRP